MYNPFSLIRKTVLITGSSSGIGRSIAIECSKMGASVIITGRNSVRLSETYNLLHGNNNQQIVADLTNENELDALVSALPKLDGLVLNAGIAKPQILQMSKVEDINEVFNTNTLAPILLSRLLLQNKKLNKVASLVFISSINGNDCVSIGSSAYAASKSALISFSKVLALELSARKIRVNVISPGMIETAFFKSSGIGLDELEADKLKYPLKRYGLPEEVAYAAVYLLSDTTQWMTGSNIKIDGGFTLQ